MPVKFLHTADGQISMNARHTGAASSLLRDARFLAAEKLLQIVSRKEFDFATLAGDTIENHAVSLEDVDRTAEILDLPSKGSVPAF